MCSTEPSLGGGRKKREKEEGCSVTCRTACDSRASKLSNKKLTPNCAENQLSHGRSVQLLCVCVCVCACFSRTSQIHLFPANTQPQFPGTVYPRGMNSPGTPEQASVVGLQFSITHWSQAAGLPPKHGMRQLTVEQAHVSPQQPVQPSEYGRRAAQQLTKQPRRPRQPASGAQIWDTS